MNNELVLSLIINTIFTAGAYLCVPVIIGFISRKRTAKQIKRIIFINGAVVWFIFALIRAENNIQGSGASVFLWSAVAHRILKTKCLKKEEPVTSHTSVRGNYNIMSEDVYLDPSNAIELEKKHPATAAQSPPIIPQTKRYKICHKCNSEFDANFVHCPYCGKKVRENRPKRRSAWIATLLVVLIFVAGCLYIVKARLDEIRDNAFAAMHDQKFSDAKDLLDTLPDAETKYEKEYAYINAGILMEHGEYLNSLRAFRNQDLPVPDDVTDELYRAIYQEGITLYRKGSYNSAQSRFASLYGYRQSNDYLTLIRCHKSSIGQYYKELLELISFEDAKTIILDNYNYSRKFLTGSWKSLHSSHYFKIDEKGNLNTNIPKTSWGNNFKLSEGIISIGSNNNYKANYTIRIVSKNMIVVFSLKDYQSYWLIKE